MTPIERARENALCLVNLFYLQSERRLKDLETEYTATSPTGDLLKVTVEVIPFSLENTLGSKKMEELKRLKDLLLTRTLSLKKQLLDDISLEVEWRVVAGNGDIHIGQHERKISKPFKEFQTEFSPQRVKKLLFPETNRYVCSIYAHLMESTEEFKAFAKEVKPLIRKFEKLAKGVPLPSDEVWRRI